MESLNLISNARYLDDNLFVFLFIYFFCVGNFKVAISTFMISLLGNNCGI